MLIQLLLALRFKKIIDDTVGSGTLLPLPRGWVSLHCEKKSWHAVLSWNLDWG
jgi:hypothetical protein